MAVRLEPCRITRAAEMSRGLVILGVVLLSSGLVSCAPTEKKPQGPKSKLDQKPWNPPIPGQGAGPMGGMQQQPRR